MPYQLTYAFNGDPGLTLLPKYINTLGIISTTVPVVSSFEMTGEYGFTLTVTSGYQGFIGFFNGSTVVIMFAVNPQEGENLDAKVSLLRAVGPGGISYIYRVFNNTNNFPIIDAEVWISSDVNGLNVIGGTTKTDSQGNALFELPAGTYYFWTRHSHYSFNNPERVVVS